MIDKTVLLTAQENSEGYLEVILDKNIAPVAPFSVFLHIFIYKRQFGFYSVIFPVAFELNLTLYIVALVINGNLQVD